MRTFFELTCVDKRGTSSRAQLEGIDGLQRSAGARTTFVGTD